MCSAEMNAVFRLLVSRQSFFFQFDFLEVGQYQNAGANTIAGSTLKQHFPQELTNRPQKMTEPVALIFDIGKTNKKALVFNQQLQVLQAYSEQMETVEDEDGFPTEDLQKLANWLQQILDHCLQNPAFSVKAVNASAYGATLVHIDASGQTIQPGYDYLKPLPDGFSSSFYQRYGGREAVCIATASPPLGMLNTGQHLLWLKTHRPEKFGQTSFALHMPQYLVWLLHGQPATDLTGLGCHTALWDFEASNYHHWVKAEGLTGKLPPLQTSGHAETVTRNGHTFKAGTGIHDSSASLAVYQEAIKNPFVLVSTGTWSITLNPFATDPLTAEDMQQDCLNYLSHRGEKVRAARLFMGNEHDLQTAVLASRFNCSADYFKTVQADPEIFARVRQNREFARLLAFNGSPMLQMDYSQFKDYKTAYHALMAELMHWQCQSIETAIGSSKVQDVYLSGGFCQNPLFVKFLPELMRGKRFFRTSLDQSSALGAAVVIKQEWNPDLDLSKSLQFTPLPGG